MHFAIENGIEVMLIPVCDGCIMLLCRLVSTLSAILSEHEELQLTTEQESVTSCHNKLLVDMETSKQNMVVQITKDGV